MLPTKNPLLVCAKTLLVRARIIAAIVVSLITTKHSVINGRYGEVGVSGETVGGIRISHAAARRKFIDAHLRCVAAPPREKKSRDSLSAAPGPAMPPASGRPARTQRAIEGHGGLLVLIVTKCSCNSGVRNCATPVS